MKFFKKYFTSKPEKYTENAETSLEENQRQLPIDEFFVSNFVNKGGKFFYPENMDDFKSELIKLQGYLKIDHFSVWERSYLHFLKKLKVPVKYGFEMNDVFLGGCESLIAEEGAIMTTGEHTGEFRNADLPKKRVIIAMSSQILSNKAQALSDINRRHDHPPSNIQTISVFAQPDNDLMGKLWFETYLFLIENQADE